MSREYNALFDLTELIALQIDSVVIAATGGGKVMPEQLPFIQRGVKEKLTDFRPRLKGLVVRVMRKSADWGLTAGVLTAQVATKEIPELNVNIGTSYIGKGGQLIRHDAAKEVFVDSKWRVMQAAIVADLQVHKKTGVSVTDSVFDITRQTEKTLKNQIGSAVMAGATIKIISELTHNTLSRPTAEVLKTIGDNKILKQAVKAAKPTPGYSLSTFTNMSGLLMIKAMSAYNAGIRSYAQSKPICKGYISRVNSGNPEPYDASINGKFFRKGEEPDPPYHFGCQCNLENVYGKEPPRTIWGDADQKRGYDYWTPRHVRIVPAA